MVAFSFHRQVPSPASLADVAAYPPLARMFSIPSADTFKLTASAIAVPGRKLTALLDGLTPVRPDSLEVTATSTWGSLPGLAPYHLFKATHQSAWIAGAGKPVLRLRWQGKRTIHRMVIAPVQGFAAAPESIKIASPDGVRFATVGLDGITAIVPPLKTNEMSISFPQVEYTGSAQPTSGQPVQLPVGISRIYIPALNGLVAREPSARAKFSIPCGRGPWLTIDGQRYPTQVSGEVGDLTSFHPVQVQICSDGSILRLPPGQHRVLAPSQGAFSVTDLSLVSGYPSQPATGAAGAVPLKATAAGPANSGGGRTVTIMGWQSEFRQVRIGPGGASYLELHQNANSGWVATLNGKTLTPVKLDGWQQAFVVPAGAGGVITLRFAPVRFYHAWIILSAAGALALLALATARRRRRRVHDQMDRAFTRTAPATSLPLSGGWLQRTVFRSRWPTFAFARGVSMEQPAPAPRPVSHEVAVAAVGAGQRFRPSRPPLSARVGLGLVCVVIALIGGPVALAVPVLAVAAFVWPDWYAAIAFAAMIATGLITTLAAQPTVIGTGAFSGPAQALALVALAAALIPSWPGAHRRTSLQVAGQARATQPGGESKASGPDSLTSGHWARSGPGPQGTGGPRHDGAGTGGAGPRGTWPVGPARGGPAAAASAPGQPGRGQAPSGPGPDRSGPGQPWPGRMPGGPGPYASGPGQPGRGRGPGGPGPDRSGPGQAWPGGVPGGPGPDRSGPGQSGRGPVSGGPVPGQPPPGRMPGGPGPARSGPGQQWRGPGPGGPAPGQSWPRRAPGGPRPDGSVPGQPGRGPEPGAPGGRRRGGPPWPDMPRPEPSADESGFDWPEPGQPWPGRAVPPPRPRPWEPGADRRWPGQFDVGQGSGGSGRRRRDSDGTRWPGHGGADQP